MSPRSSAAEIRCSSTLDGRPEPGEPVVGVLTELISGPISVGQQLIRGRPVLVASSRDRRQVQDAVEAQSGGISRDFPWPEPPRSDFAQLKGIIEPADSEQSVCARSGSRSQDQRIIGFVSGLHGAFSSDPGEVSLTDLAQRGGRQVVNAGGDRSAGPPGSSVIG